MLEVNQKKRKLASSSLQHHDGVGIQQVLKQLQEIHQSLKDWSETLKNNEQAQIIIANEHMSEISEFFTTCSKFNQGVHSSKADLLGRVTQFIFR